VSDTDRIEAATAHRPWPLPDAPWVMFQSWQDLLFAHWPLPPEQLRTVVPPPLELDLHDGRAWLGITPFRVSGLRARGIPPLPGLSEFLEVNCRTYVRYGDRTAVFFLSLDAESTAAVLGARALYHLPYRRADMSAHREGEWIEYRSRLQSGGAELVARYRPVGSAAEPAPGTLEHFLTERYALMTVSDDGKVGYADIHHPPWRLRPAEARIEKNTIAESHGLMLPDRAPLLHFSAVQDTLIWMPKRLP
jgi:uncharacterized protein